MEESAILNAIKEKEDKLALSDNTIFGIPIWRIVRYHTRLFYIAKITSYKAGGSGSQVVGKKKIKAISGLWKYVFKKVDTLFFPFNRLVLFKDTYLDKFTDPVIEEGEWPCQKYIIIDPPNYEGNYSRIHKDNVLSNESRLVSVKLFSIVLRMLSPILFKKKVSQLFNTVKEPFCLDNSYLSVYYSKLANFTASYFHYFFWLNLLRPKRVMIVYREGYFPVIAACKKCGIPVVEFQHGITLDKTVSFTGDYDSRIDPDYFLVFGSYWKGPQFGMDVDRLINIGWAYKDFVTKRVKNDSFKKQNAVLVISSPEISDNILNALQVISKECPNTSFHIRLHPCETYNQQQIDKLSNIGTAILADNKIDSAVVLPHYSFVIGENSSVVYEALSVGCRVGLLNFCGLHAPIDKPGISDSFYIINNPEDFHCFLNTDTNDGGNKSAFYSDFDSDNFNDFINNYCNGE